MVTGSSCSPWFIRVCLVLFLYACTAVHRTDSLGPPTVVDHTEEYVGTNFGQILKLFCTASGSPLPTITWSSVKGRRRRKVSPGSRINITETSENGRTKSVVTINMVVLRDGGKYICKATNTNGTDDYKIEVSVSGTPMAPEHDKSSVINSSSILVSWNAVTKVAAPVLRYTLYYNANKEKHIDAVNITANPALLKYSFVITGLKQLTTYSIYISASNVHGEGETSMITIEETMQADPDPPAIYLNGENPITHDKVSLKLVPSSRNKGKVFYQIFVEDIQERPTSRPLSLPSIYGNHSLNKTKYHIYIAANFDEKLPHNFILGNDQWYGYHFNRPLKPLTKYRIYIRALARHHINNEEFLFGKANILEVSTIFPPVPKLHLKRVASDMLEMTWNKIQSDNIYYKLEVKQGDKVVLLDEKITEVPYELTGLQQGETYMVYLSICVKTKCMTSTEPTQMETVSPAHNGGSMQLLIIFIVVAVVILIIIVIIAVVCLVRRRRRQKERFLKGSNTNGSTSPQAARKTPNKNSNEEEIGLIEKSGGIELAAEAQLKPLRAKPAIVNGDSSYYKLKGDWECPKENTKIIRELENDSFGTIYKGSLKNFQDFDNGSVVMRILEDNPSESTKSEFLSILETMKKLPVHKGIANLLGCITTKQDKLTIIMEYVPYGDLLGYLRCSRGLRDQYYKSEKSPIKDFSSVELMSFAEQIAAAMAHLERNKIIHGDLSARNVLIDHQGHCKLTNIGERPVVFDKDTYALKKKGRLLIKWAAIEVLFKKIRTIQSDVWSFGVLLYEIATIGGCPYTGKDEKWLLDMLKDDYRLPCPEHVSEALYSVMSDCWLNEPEERPNFEKLLKVMKTLTLMNKHQDHINMTKYDGQLFSKLDDS